MATPLTLTPGHRPDGTAVLWAAGEIDMSNAALLSTALEGTAGRVVVDLTGVEYLDSAGLSVLFAFVERIEVVAAPLLMPVLKVSGISALTAVHIQAE